MHNYNDTDLQKLSVKNNTAKQRVKRDLKELSLYEIFKQYTVKIVKELTYERFKGFGITREDLGIKDGYDDTNYGKYDTIAKKLEDHDINQQSLVISYDEIFERTYDEIVSNLKNDHELLSLLEQIYNKNLKPVFQQHFDTIKTFYSEAKGQFHLDDMIDPENELDLNNNFSIVFLPWLEDTSFSDDNKNSVKIAEVATYQKILDKYDLWKNIFKSISEKSGYVINDNAISKIKFDIACLVNDWKGTSTYLDMIHKSDSIKIILWQENVWQLIFKYNIDPQKRVEFIESVFKLARDFEDEAITNIGIIAFKCAAAQNDEQAMTAVLNCIENSDIKVTVLCHTLTHALEQNNDQIIDVVFKKVVEIKVAERILSNNLVEAFLEQNDQLMTIVLDKAEELNITAKVFIFALMRAWHEHNDPLVTTILNKARVLNVEKKVLNAIFSTALNKNDTETMIRVLNIAIERNVKIDLSKVVKSDKAVDILVIAFFKASGKNDYRVMQEALSIAKNENLIKQVLYKGFLYSQNNDGFKSFKRLWTLTDALQYDNEKIKEIKLQVLEHNDFKIPVSIAENRNSEEVNFLYEEIKKFNEDIRLKILQANNNQVLEGIFISATKHSNAEMVYDIWSKAARLVGDSNQIQLQLLEADNFKAFRLSAQHENKEIVKFLYSKADKFKIQNEMLEFDRFRALGLAVDGNHKDVVEFLIEKRPDIVNAVIDHLDNTVLHRAVFLNHIDIVKTLLNNKAVVDVQNQHYVTPLYRAVHYNHVDIARLLIEKGARVDIKNNNGETALDLAHSKLNKFKESKTPEKQQKYQQIISKLSGQEVSSLVSACLPKKSKKGESRNKRDLKVRVRREAGGNRCLLAEDEKGKIDKKKTGIRVNKKNLAKSKINKKKLKTYQDGLNNRLNIAITQNDKNAQNLIKEEQGQLNKLIIEIQQAQAIRNFHMLSEEYESKEFNDKLLYVIERTNGAVISPESLQHFKQVIKINLLRIVSPLIRSEKFRDLLLNNLEKFGQDQDLLNDVFARIKHVIAKKYEGAEELSYEDFENIENEINEEISSVEVEIKSLADQDVKKSHLLDYVLMSMGLSKLLADTDASADLINRMSYEALVTLGALIHDHENHIKANHHKHKHNPQMNALNNRIGKSQLLAIAHDLYKLHKGNVNQDELKSKAIKDKIGSYGSVDSNYIINDLSNRLSSEEIKNIFEEENIKNFSEIFKDYDRDVITIRSNQISITDYKITIRVQHGSKTVIIGKNADINNIDNYVLDEENLQIKLKIDSKEYIITPELEGEKVKYFLNIEGYKVKIGSVINNADRSVERDIHHKLNQLGDRIELLESKKSIEDIANTKISNEDYDNTINRIKQDLLAKGVREETWKQFNEHLESPDNKIYTEYVNTVEENLTKNNIEFDRSKFELAKIKGAKGGKFMSVLAIYDLIDSTADLKGLGDSPLNTIFGINGLLDAMDDVRESLSTQYARPNGKIKTKLSRSGLGKITSKIPADVRKGFVRIINSSVVQGITFVTIAWQFGHSIDQIVKGENVALNSYFATSSGIKLTSMGVSFGIRGTMFFGAKTTGKIFSKILLGSKVLARASIVTASIDVAVTIGIEIHERIEYTKAVAAQVPLLPGNEQAEVFFAKIIEPFRDVEKEYQNHITAKTYLSLFKASAIKILELELNLGAVVEHITNVEDRYDEIIKHSGHTNQNDEMAVKDDHCQLIRNNTGFSYNTKIKANREMIDLSKLDLSDVLPLTPHTLVMTEWWEKFVCDTKIPSSNRDKCHKELNDKQAYFSDLSKKHQPHLTKSEYNNGIRIISVPQSYKEFTTCTDIKNSLQYKDTYGIAGQHFKCNVDKIYRNCTQSLTFSDEPLIFTKLSRQTSQNSILYLSGPQRLTAANYPAIMYVSGGSDVRWNGSRNHSSVFLINNSIDGILKGGEIANNTLVMNYNPIIGNIYVDLAFGTISWAGSHIRLYDIYNYISNSTAQQSITTDCKTRYISAGGGSRGNTVRQSSANCKDEDHEIRVVHKNDVHYRGSKLAIFVVNRNSNNATINVDNNFNTNKNSTNIIRLEDLDIEKLRIKEAEGYYNLILLTDDGQTTSVKVVDDLKNLVIYTEGSQTIVVQNKSLSDITRDMQYQKLNHSGEYIDDRILENSKTKLKAVILKEVDDIKSTPWTAKYIAKKSYNLGLPVQVIATKHHEKELVERAIIHDTFSKDIYVDLFASGDFKFGYPFSYVESVKIKDENTTIFGFLDGFKIYLNRNGHNIIGYVFNETRSISDIIADGDYQDITNELNTTIPIKYDDGILLIGTKEDDVLHSDPNYKTHLIGNGGKDRYVVSVNLSSYFILEITIYDPNGPTVDVYDLKNELKGKFKSYPHLQRHWDRNYDVAFDLSVNDKIFLRIYTKQCKLKSSGNLVPFSEDMRNVSIVCGFNQELLHITRKNMLSHLDSDNWDPLMDLKNLFNNDNADINAQDNQGNTALHFACKNCNYDVVKYLIEEKGAKINVKNKDGKTPLDLANECQQSKKEQIVELFGKVQSELGKQLLSAARDGDLTKVRSLISKGATPNIQDREKGATPLHYAAKEGHLEVVRYLVEKGADIHAKDKGGRTLLDLAEERKHNDIVGYLKKIKEERRRPIQRPRRSARIEDAVVKEESLEREEVSVTSSATKPSSWINGGIKLMKGLIRGSVDGVIDRVKSVVSSVPTEDRANLLDAKENTQFSYGYREKDTYQHERIWSDGQQDSTVDFSNLLSNKNTLLLHCIADAMDKHPIKCYKELKNKGVEVVPSTNDVDLQPAVYNSLRKFFIFIDEKIKDLDSKEQCEIRNKIKKEKPEIIASLIRGEKYRGNVGLDDVLEKCKQCFSELLPKLITGKYESYEIDKTLPFNVTVSNPDEQFEKAQMWVRKAELLKEQKNTSRPATGLSGVSITTSSTQVMKILI